MSDFETAARAEVTIQDEFASELLRAAETFRESIARCFKNFPNYATDLARYESVAIDNNFEVLIDHASEIQSQTDFPDTCNICYYPADLYNQIGKAPRLYFVFSEGKFVELEYWQDEVDQNANIITLSIGDDGQLHAKIADDDAEYDGIQENQTWQITDTTPPIIKGVASFGRADPQGTTLSDELREELSFLIERAKEDIDDAYPFNVASRKPPERIVESLESIDDTAASALADNIRGMLDLDRTPFVPGAGAYSERDTSSPILGRSACYRINNKIILFEEASLPTNDCAPNSQLSMTVVEKHTEDGLTLARTRRYYVRAGTLETEYSEELSPERKHDNYQTVPRTIGQSALMKDVEESFGMHILTADRLGDANRAISACIANPNAKIL